MTQKIGHVTLIVRDYDEAITFYTDRLRFELLADTALGGGKRWVLVAPPGGTALLLAKAVTLEQAARIGDQTGGQVFLFLHTDDFWRDYREMESRGVRFTEEPRREAYGTVAVFEDLYGNRWDLLELGRGEYMEDAVSTVRGGYDRWAAVYDHDANPLQALEEPIVRAAVGNARGLSTLDLGCGTGRHALWLASAGASVTAVDFSEGMLAEARRKPGADAVRFVVHDLHTPLPFADGAFDLVVSGLVLEHLRELGRFFAEARRVVKPGGRAVVSGMHPAMMLRGTQARFTDPASGELVQPGSVPHTVSAFVMAAVRAGFRLADAEEFAPDDEFARRFTRAAKYVGWPMLVVLRLEG